MPTLRDPVFGCLLWQGRCDKDGYGFQGSRRAHIVAYEEAYGPVPEGQVVDHLCRRRHCVEPTHLEAVAQAENEHRKKWRYRARRSTCRFGHDLSLAIITPEGGRVCRSCRGAS